MDDEEETYRLWKIRKTIMQVSAVGLSSLYQANRTRSGLGDGQQVQRR